MAVVSADTVEAYPWGQGSQGWHLLASDALSVIEECVPPGDAEARHLHRNAQQFFYVLSGVATLECDGEIAVMKSGMGLHIPAGCAHQLSNQGVIPLRFLVISSPPSHGDRVSVPLAGGSV